MFRKLMTSTALATLVMTSVAMAGTKADNTAAKPDHGMAVFTMKKTPDGASASMVFVQPMNGQVLASALIGQNVFSGVGSDATNVGDVNDVVLSKDGSAEAIVIGVGGFLGIGEKDVAVSFNRVGWFKVDGMRYLTIDATRKELEAAPAFDREVVTGARELRLKLAAKAKVDELESDKDSTGAMKSDKSAMTDETEKSDMTAKSGETDKTVTGSTSMSAGKTAPGIDDKSSARTDERMSPVDMTALSAGDVIGTSVRGADDESIGEVSDVLITAKGRVDAYVVDVGGFLGMGEKSVAIDAGKIDIANDKNGYLVIRAPFTEKQLKSYPDYTEAAYRKNPDSVVIR